MWSSGAGQGSSRAGRCRGPGEERWPGGASRRSRGPSANSEELGPGGPSAWGGRAGVPSVSSEEQGPGGAGAEKLLDPDKEK